MITEAQAQASPFAQQMAAIQALISESFELEPGSIGVALLEALDGAVMYEWLLQEARAILTWTFDPFNDPGLTHEEAIHAAEGYARQERCQRVECFTCDKMPWGSRNGG
jgi:hypothetical protein